MTDSANPPLTLETTSWNGVFAGIFSGIAVALQVGKIGVSLPLIRQEFAVNFTLLSVYAGFLAIVAAALGLGFGSLSRRVGPQRAAIAGLLLVCAGSAVGALATGFTALMLSRILEACGFALVGTSAAAVIQSHCAPSDRSMALALWAVWIPAGIALMMAIGYLSLDHVGWRGIYWICAAGPLVSVLWLLSLPGSPVAGRPSRVKPDYRGVLNRRSLLAAGLFFCFTAVNLIIMYYLPTLLVDRFDMEPTHAALVGFCSAAIQIPINVLGGALLKKGVGAKPMFLFSAIGMAIAGVLVFREGSGLVTCIAAGICFSLAGAITPAVVWSTVPDLSPTPADTPLVSGLIFQSAGLGQFMGPVLAAFAVETSGSWSSAAWVILILMLASILCILRMRPAI